MLLYERFHLMFKSLLECNKCPSLCESRSQIIWADDRQYYSSRRVPSEVMVVGEAPGQNEDEQGLPFVGRAGQKLDEMLLHAGIPREWLYVTNAVKCRPANNRTPLTAEIENCRPYLIQQITQIKPHTILVVGATAMWSVLGIDKPISKVRGEWQHFHLEYEGRPILIPTMVTYHPSYILRQGDNSPSAISMFNDIKKVAFRTYMFDVQENMQAK